ncbi:C-type mannose receptor 2-like [Branchiostoma floridae x Branchiostoma belcheri]
MPRDSATNNFLIDLKNAVDKNSYFRFGLTDDNQEGVWMWDDNVPLGDFRAWGPGEPNNWYGVEEEDCAEYDEYDESSSFSNSWNDANCARTNRKFICQVSPSASCPGYREFRGTCYKAFGIWKDFWAANKHCRRDADGGSLAMPKDAATNRFLSSLIRRFKNKYFYIGLHDLTEEGRFQWVDGHT